MGPSRMVAVPPGGRRLPATVFELYGPRDTDWLNVERALSAIDGDGILRFSSVGAPLPCRHVDRSEARAISDRFSLELLAEYAAELGIRPFDDDFYLPDRCAVLVERRLRDGGGRTFTLAEARASAPIPTPTSLPAFEWRKRTLVAGLLSRAGSR